MLDFIMSSNYYGRFLKNGKKSGGFFIVSGNFVFELIVIIGIICII